MIFDSEKGKKPEQTTSGQSTSGTGTKVAGSNGSSTQGQTIDPTAGQMQFAVEGIYIRDISYEAPNTPEGIKPDWQPEVKFELNTQARRLENDRFEVILKITVTVKHEKKMAFLLEVQQAGIFLLKGFNDAQRGQMLGSFCPNMLYPYARELVSNMASRGGYPPLYLAPVNFDALYADHMARMQEAQKGGSTGTAGSTTAATATTGN
jgi:preprotein translocase subunit SecB